MQRTFLQPLVSEVPGLSTRGRRRPQFSAASILPTNASKLDDLVLLEKVSNIPGSRSLCLYLLAAILQKKKKKIHKVYIKHNILIIKLRISKFVAIRSLLKIVDRSFPLLALSIFI